MSRSRRKSPIKSWAKSGSMAWWKRSSNKRHRARQKQQLDRYIRLNNLDDYLPRLLREDSDVWDSPLDGGPGWFPKPHENSLFNPVTEEFDSWSGYSLEDWKQEFRK